MNTLRIALVALMAVAAGILGSANAQTLLFTLDTPNPQARLEFATTLAVRDVNGDGKGDIAATAGGEDVGSNASQGRAYVFSGADGSLLFTLDTPNPQAYVYFGNGMAVGDVDGDGTFQTQERFDAVNSPVSAAGASHSSARDYAAPLAAALAAGIIALAAGGWYARRRLS